MAGRTRVSSGFESCGLARTCGGGGDWPVSCHQVPTQQGETSGFCGGPLGRGLTDCRSLEGLCSLPPGPSGRCPGK